MCDLSSELRSALARGRESLAADAQGHLRLGVRQRLWAGLGSRQVAYRGRAVPSPGHTRRTVLTLLCARRLMPVWEAACPDDPFPTESLQRIERLLKGEEEMAIALTADRREFRRVEELIRERHSRLGLVLYAVLQSATCALFDEDFDPEHLADWASDLADRDFYSWDTAFLASCVEAGGSLISETACPVRRRSYWQWYLEEAIPIAYRSCKDFDTSSESSLE